MAALVPDVAFVFLIAKNLTGLNNPFLSGISNVMLTSDGALLVTGPHRLTQIYLSQLVSLVRDQPRGVGLQLDLVALAGSPWSARHLRLNGSKTC